MRKRGVRYVTAKQRTEAARRRALLRRIIRTVARKVIDKCMAELDEKIAAQERKLEQMLADFANLIEQEPSA